MPKPLADQAVRDLFALAWHWRLMSEADKAHDGGEFFTPFSLVSRIAHVAPGP